jgi:hypothetical protein
MKYRILGPVALLVFTATMILAQTGPGEPSGTKTLAATMNVYVFPAEGQAADQQSKDEAECYSWAVENTDTDPFELGKLAEQQQRQTEQAKQEVSQAGKGSAAKGALIGAAAGALIGEVASDDAGSGAAIGAGLGALGGRRARRQKQAQANQQIDQQSAQAQQYSQTQIDNFKKAFSVCLEAKDYMVKF